jgi:ribosome-associated translation inhibitor RaiA
LFVQINTDNHIKSDAEANERLERKIRSRLRRFEKRLTHVEVHVSDANGSKGGTDKKVSLEVRPTGHEPLAVHAEGQRIEDAVTVAADKAVRALDHTLGRLGDSRGH